MKFTNSYEYTYIGFDYLPTIHRPTCMDQRLAVEWISPALLVCILLALKRYLALWVAYISGIHSANKYTFTKPPSLPAQLFVPQLLFKILFSFSLSDSSIKSRLSCNSVLDNNSGFLWSKVFIFWSSCTFLLLIHPPFPNSL